jgi:hypothetical protein
MRTWIEFNGCAAAMWSSRRLDENDETKPL